MRIGVVIPAYKSAAFLPSTIRSVQRQTNQSWSLVVVDDGSPDEGHLIASTFAEEDQRITAVTQPNLGVSAARNAGLRLLGPTDAVLFLDGDDELLDDALETLSRALDEHPSAVAVFGSLVLVDEQGALIDEIGQAIDGLNPTPSRHSRYVLFDETVRKNPCRTPSGMLFRTFAVLSSGGYDEAPSVWTAEDFLTVMKVARLGPLLSIPNYVTRYRRHAGAGLATYFPHHIRAIREVRSRIYVDRGTTAEQRRSIRKAWRQHNAVKARKAYQSGQRSRAAAHAALVLWGRPTRLSLAAAGASRVASLRKRGRRH